MNQMMQYAQEMQMGFALEAEGVNAEEFRNRAEWARAMAAEIRIQGTTRAKEAPQANGEVLPRPDANPLYDTLAIPDLAAVDASLERSRLLLHAGTDIAALALDASTSIQAENSLEKCWLISSLRHTKWP